MITKLTSEQRDAIRKHDGPVPVEDDETQEVYYIVDRRMLDLLHDDDRRAIQNGIADMEAGRVLSLDELDRRIQTQIKASTKA